MAAPVIRWTPEEAPLYAALARSALVAVLDGGSPLRASPGTRFAAEITEADGELVLVLHIDAARATLALIPEGDPRWRDGWILEIAIGDQTRELAAGAPAIDLIDPRRVPPRVRLRVARRAVVRALDGVDEVVPLHDRAFHRYTRQSSAAEPAAERWAAPTAAEAAPWWELDLGAPHHLARIAIDLVRPPSGARVAIHAYGFLTPAGEPPPGSALVDLAALAGDGERAQVTVATAVIARFVRITVSGDTVPLAVLGAEVLAADLDAGGLVATLRRSFALYRDRTLFAVRDPDGAYRAHATYGATWDGAAALARAIERRLPSTGRVFIGNLLRNRPAWVTVDLATLLGGHVSVPIAPDDPDPRLAEILARARPAVVFCEPEHAERVARLATDAVCIACGDAALAALIADGADRTGPPPPVRAPDDLYAVLFTSGSTGAPKGVMRSYAAFHAMITSYAIGHMPRHLSFQPLSHLSERMYLPAVLLNGGIIGFSRGGAHLLGELRAFEPTTLGSVPRLFEVLYAGHQRRLRAALAAAPHRPRAAVEDAVTADTRAAFGQRLLALSVGSAPVGAEVLGFLRRVFADVWVTEGYGSTEVGSIAFDGKVLADVEVRLRPVGGATDPDRGEIWVKTPFVTSGYLGDPDATAAAIDGDGFFATGDLGERGPDGRVRVIGRVRNTVKLAQGEFVSPERIEAVLATAPGVDQIYVHAAPGASGVAALVVPSTPAEVDRAGLLAALHARGRAAGLAPYELPRGIVVSDPLTAAAGLLTASGKLARGALAARFGDALEAVARGPDTSTSIDVEDEDLLARVMRAATRVLGRTVDASEPLSAGLGVDSLAAAEILAVLGDDLGREVPLAWWFEARTLAGLATRLASFAADAPAADPLVAADLALGPATPIAPRPPRAIRHVLVTGATGFLGAHLLEALHARGVRATCLVRASDDAAALARLRAALADREIPLAALASARAIAGDLAALDGSRALAAALDEVDAIIHAGATVSWLASYAALRGPNVAGTLALLDRAAARGLPFHHVSTISTAPPDGDEDALLDRAAAAAATPYVLSKWLAEQQVRRAAAAGLPVAIYRPAMIAGHSARGVGNRDDFLSRYLAGLVELGCYLDRADAIVDMTPVDFVARAIVALALAHPPAGATYHLANVDHSLDHAALGRAINASGRHLVPVTYAELRARLAAAPTSRLRPLAAFFPETFALAMGPWPRARTTAALAALDLAPPPIDAAIIARYLAFLAR